MHPILFRLGPITLYSYGLALAIGFLAALNLAARRAPRLGLDPARIKTLGLVVLLAGIVGARGLYVFLNWDLFQLTPLEILRLDHGGLVFYGGLGLGLIGAFLYIRRNRLPVGKTLDLATPPLVLAHSIGRIGCFLNGCCYGKPATVAWAVAFPYDPIARHPTQLYESAFLFLLFLFLLRLQSHTPPPLLRRPGSLFLLYGLLYGVWRFGVEFLRDDSPRLSLGWTAFQWMSVGWVVIAGFVLILRQVLSERDRSASHDWSG